MDIEKLKILINILYDKIKKEKINLNEQNTFFKESLEELSYEDLFYFFETIKTKYKKK